MLTAFRSLIVGGLAAVVALAGMVSTSQAEPLAQRVNVVKVATNVVIYGSAKREFELAGHKLTVQKALITSTLLGTTITGQITHERSFLPDEQMIYTIKKYQGKVVSVQFKILGAGFSTYTSKYSRSYIGRRFSPQEADQLMYRLCANLDSKWESAAELIVASVA